MKNVLTEHSKGIITLGIVLKSKEKNTLTSDGRKIYKDQQNISLHRVVK